MNRGRIVSSGGNCQLQCTLGKVKLTFLAGSSWDRCRGQAPRSPTMQSPPVPGSQKAARPSSRSEAPAAWAPNQAVVRGVAERVTSSRRRHARSRTPSVPPSTCFPAHFLTPCLPDSAFRQPGNPTVRLDLSCPSPTTTGEEPFLNDRRPTGVAEDTHLTGVRHEPRRGGIADSRVATHGG